MNIFQAEMIVFHPCHFRGDVHLPSTGIVFVVAWATVFQETPSTHLFLIPQKEPRIFRNTLSATSRGDSGAIPIDERGQF
jgi:hypothetical protein